MAKTSTLKSVPSVRDSVSEAEWTARVDLAASYRLVAREGWDEMLSTHISARIPDDPEKFLVNPYGVLFSQITASSLVKVDFEGNVYSDTDYPVNTAAIVIHGGLLEARRDVASAVHLHTPAGVAVSTHKKGLMPLNQRALYFQPILAYHDYEGLALDMDERESLVRDLGTENWAMLLRNHGTLTVGRTIGQAYVYMFFLERACQMQVQTLAGGVPLTELSDELIEKVPQQAFHWEHMGKLEWPALKKLLNEKEPDYKN